VYIRVIDKRTPQGDIVSLCMNVTDSIHRQIDVAETASPVHAVDDGSQPNPLSSEPDHIIDAGATCQTIEAPRRGRLTLTEVKAFGLLNAPIGSGEEVQYINLGTASARDGGSGKSEDMFAANRGQMRHVMLPPRKANISNLIAAVDRRRAIQEPSDNVRRVSAKSALSRKELVKLALMSAIKPTTLLPGSAAHVKPLVLLPEQRVEDVV
jgi:hypothetical protein